MENNCAVLAKPSTQLNLLCEMKQKQKFVNKQSKVPLHTIRHTGNKGPAPMFL